MMGRVLPILFNTEMVRAIMDGRKTVTRRKVDKDISYRFDVENDGKNVVVYIDQATGDSYRPEKMCRYQKGDILYVRETWKYVYDVDDADHIIENTGRYVYCADDDMPFNYWVDADGSYRDRMPWSPSIHMPKEAARIWLKVTDVRVDFLQNMNTDDFLKEGVVVRPEAYNDPENAYQQARSVFVQVWDNTLKKSEIGLYCWDMNPWVWVIEFERCEKPEDK